MTARQSQVLDEYDRPVPGANIYVFDTTTLSAANLTVDGVVPLEQPLKTDEFGVYTYFANDGFYREDIWYSGKLRYREIAKIGIPAEFKGDPGGNIMAIGPFTNGSTLAIPVGTDIVRTSGWAASGKGAAHYIYDAAVNAAYVTANPRSSFISSNARGFRLTTDQRLSVTMFGALGDDATNDSAAFLAAIAFVTALHTPGGDGYGYNVGSPPLRVPMGRYYLSNTTLDLNSSFVLEGEGMGGAGGGISVLRWAANTTGIRVQRYNTNGVSGTDAGTTHKGGDGTILRGLFLKGAFLGTPVEGEYHGVHARATIAVVDCQIFDFQGDGIHVEASLGGGAIEGAANLFHIERVFTQACRDGLYVRGNDVNAGTVIAFSGIINRRWCVNDQSFLGNTYVACHAAGNGIPNSAPFGVVHNNGHLFYVKSGQDAGAGGNSPPATATSNTWWGYWREGGVSAASPQWTGGISVRGAGPYFTDNANSSQLFLNCYAEFDQTPCRFSAGTVAIGGGTSTADGGAALSGAIGFLRLSSKLWVQKDLQVDGGSHVLGLVPATIENVLQLNAATFNRIVAQSWTGGGQEDGDLAWIRGFGCRLSGNGGVHLRTWPDNVDRVVATVNGCELPDPALAYYVGGQKVVGARGAAVADAVAAIAAPTQAEFNALVTQFNALAARLRAATGHGLIA